LAPHTVVPDWSSVCRGQSEWSAVIRSVLQLGLIQHPVTGGSVADVGINA
jgi:hypothetical protein